MTLLHFANTAFLQIGSKKEYLLYTFTPHRHMLMGTFTHAFTHAKNKLIRQAAYTLFRHKCCGSDEDYSHCLCFHQVIIFVQ